MTDGASVATSAAQLCEAMDARRSASEADGAGALAERAVIVQLVAVLGGGGVELEPVAAELAARPEQAREALERTERTLLRRLHGRADDFAATTALQTVNTASARLDSCVDPLAAERFEHLGLSGSERARRWWRSKLGRAPRRSRAPS